MRRQILGFLMLLLVHVNFAPLLAQNEPKQPAVSQIHDAKAADIASPDAILAAAYDVISGPAAQERDWDRMRSLFYPGAQLISTRVKKEGGSSATFVTPQGYIDRAEPYFKKNGFFEREIARRGERWGNVMEAFSTYESRHDPKDPLPFARGINSFQLFFDGTRWWIMTLYWAEETPQIPLPPEFLPPSH
jgi:hypothetical protein